MEEELYRLCKAWIDKNKVSCPEHIWQMDFMVAESQNLAENICNLIGYYDYGEED